VTPAVDLPADIACEPQATVVGRCVRAREELHGWEWWAADGWCGYAYGHAMIAYIEWRDAQPRCVRGAA